ncbi:Putative metal ion binding protein [Phytophthora palmivora]|uniref:Metal ion binding protein n=1 Tax=Phytophthora palmivora TaxID=4796 RepID=A0A2P4XL17_9STRA|nr:Putative metal ion binding protein [Phytophthora palmivora]
MVRHLAVGRRASTYVRPNWLEVNCGDVPVKPQPQDAEVSEMLRGGHAMQIASAKMLEAKVADFHVVKTFSAGHLEKLQGLRNTEEKAVQRIEDAVRTKNFRFRPSLTIPAVELSSFIVGCALSPLGDTISTSYVTGVKMAVSDYYNDQIREIYANKPEVVELKEVSSFSGLTQSCADDVCVS